MRALFLHLTVTLLVAAGFTSASGPATGFGVDRFSRSDVVRFWHQVYLPSEENYEADYGPRTDLNGTEVPQTSQIFRDHVQRRVNFYRALTGLPADIDFTDRPVVRREDDGFSPQPGVTRSEAASDMAFWMARHRVVTHQPSGGSFFAVSEAGKNAAANGNLALGSFGPGAIDDYMLEPGIPTDPLFNQAVGHRRSLLYTRAKEMATGDVYALPVPSSNGLQEIRRTNTLYILGEYKREPTAQLVVWPNDGFFPAPLMTKLWSVSYSGAIFSEAQVRVTGPGGENVPVAVRSRLLGFGVDPSQIPASEETDGASTGSPRTVGESTIVFEPLIDLPDLQDVRDSDWTYQVEVTGITGNAPVSLSYSVTVINPDRLEQELVLEGAAAPPLEGASYRFDPIPSVEKYELELSVTSPADWVEGGELETKDLVTQSPIVMPDRLVRRPFGTTEGSRPLVLAFPNPFLPGSSWVLEQSLQLERDFIPREGAEVRFDFFEGFMATGIEAALQVTTNNGASWSDLWISRGDSSRTIEGTTVLPMKAASADLTPYLGESCKIRFTIRNPQQRSIFYYDFNESPYIGLFLDRIQVTNSEGPSARFVSEVPGNALKASLEIPDTPIFRQEGQDYQLRLRAVIGSQRFAWGPQLQISPSPTVLEGWEAYREFQEPGIERFDGDADGDGIPNGIEFVLGSEALNSGDSPPRATPTAEDGILKLEVPVVAEALEYVTLQAEYSTDGINWETDGVEVQVERGTLAAEVPTQGRPGLFFRWTVKLKE